MSTVDVDVVDVLDGVVVIVDNHHHIDVVAVDDIDVAAAHG